MLGSRTIKTLAALLISMTVGAIALMVLETAPVGPTVQQLAAVAGSGGQVDRLVHETAVPLQRIKWRNVIVHASAAEGPDIADRCHFVISPDAQVKPTDLWLKQLSGRHAYVPGRDFNADSIGVCLVGDFSNRGVPRPQFASLVELTRSLQQAAYIPADRVYLLNELDARTNSPGAAFPAGEFNNKLYRRPR